MKIQPNYRGEKGKPQKNIEPTGSNPYKGIGKGKIRIGLVILWLLVVAFFFIVRTNLKWR